MEILRVYQTKRESFSYLILTVLSFILVLFFLTGITRSSGAQTKELIKDAFFEIDAKRAIDSLYNRNTAAARKILSPWKEKYPEHPLWLLWDGMELWWVVLEDLHDPSNDRKFISLMQMADYEAGKILRSNSGHSDALIIRAVANGYVARLHANREDWLTSVQIGRKAYQAYEQLREVAPELPDNHFAEGMKMYYAAYIPEAYPVVKALSWFLPEGNREEGLETLEYAARHGVFARPEANYFLANILLNYEQDYEEAKKRFRYLIDRYPNNSYYRCQYFRTLAQLEEYGEMLSFGMETLESLEKGDLQNNAVLQMGVNFWVGRAYYHQGNWRSAQPFLKEAEKTGSKLVNRYDRDIYVLSAYFAGRVHEILGQPDEARKYYEIAADQKTVPEARNRSRNHLKNL